MCKIISVISCKGGVGKTTSQIINQPTIYDLLNAAISEKEDDEIKAMVHEIICHSTTVDIIPATAKLSSLETVIPAAMCQDRLIHYVLSFIKKDYDYIFLDCHPGLDVFSRNALAAADSALIPVEAHILSSDGLDQIEKMIRSVQRHLNSKLKIEGVIITKFQGNTNYCKQISDLIMRDFGDHIHIFDSYIKYAIKVAEAPTFGISLHEYAPNIDAAQAYAKIAREVMQCG